MEEKMKISLSTNHKYFLVGVYFLILEIYVIYYLSNFAGNSAFFWVCNVLPVLFAFGFFTKNISLVRGLIGISLVPQLIWTADLFSVLFFNVELIGGFTRYAFNNGSIAILPVLAHIFSSAVALIAVYRKPLVAHKSLIYSFFLIIIFQIVSLSFTNLENNVNCVYKSCLPALEGLIPFYTIVYPFGFFLLIAVPGYFLQVLLSSKKNN